MFAHLQTIKYSFYKLILTQFFFEDLLINSTFFCLSNDFLRIDSEQFFIITLGIFIFYINYSFELLNVFFL